MIKKNLKEKNILGFEVSGKLTDDDFKLFVPEIEANLKKHDKLRLMVVFTDFKGWDLHALWDDIKFDFQHFNDFEKIAMVGEKSWQKWMAIFCKPFTMARVKYFEKDDIVEAMAWLEKKPEKVTNTVLEATPY
ncbi:MAG: STAS/SEC14 domain-containing protein [Lentisphaeraceae bacterium]|nr:STAS/SEC14 domain-containing protein [Lentisphaeraceae bacterium]